MKLRTIVGLDIGTHSMKMVVARQSEGGETEIVASGEELSSGVRKGAIVNPEEAGKKIALLKARMENMAGHPIEEVMATIGGSHIFMTSSRGVVAVSRADSQISHEDVERVLQAAQALSLESNKEIIATYPRQYMVDGVGNLKDAVGMKGIRLEVDVTAVCAFTPYVKHTGDAIAQAGLSVPDYMPTPLASAEAVLTPQQKERGVALIDIGAGTTGIAVFEEGDLLRAAIFPVGSENITNDIAIGLRTEPEIAEKIKMEYGDLLAKGKKTQKIALPNGEELSFSQRTLTLIIEARVKEILQLVNKELKEIDKQGMLPAGVVFAGGGAKLPGLVDVAKKELKLASKIGVPQHMVGYPEDPAFLAALGLARRGGDFQDAVQINFGDWDVMRKVKKIFKPFIP